MTEARVTPGRDEVDKVARLLADIDAESKRELRHYLAGTTDWRMVTRIIRRCIRRLIHDPQRNLRRDHREQLLAFAAMYGLRINTGDPLTETVRFKCTADQKDEIKDAAKRAGKDPTSWVRDVVMKATET